MADIIRVLRVLEYVGPRKWVEHSLVNRGVRGEYKGHTNEGTWIIREGYLGEFPEVIKEEEVKDDA